MQIRTVGHPVLSQGFLELQPLCHSTALDNAKVASHTETGACRAASSNTAGISIYVYTLETEHVHVPSAQGLPFPPSLVHRIGSPCCFYFS